MKYNANRKTNVTGESAHARQSVSGVPLKLYRLFGVSAVMSAFGLLLASCSTDDMHTQLERNEAYFLGLLGETPDRSHLWKTAVRLNVEVKASTPVRLWAMSSGEEQCILYDYAETDAGGTVSMTVPQGYGDVVVLRYVADKKKYESRVSLTGAQEQTVQVSVPSSAGSNISSPYGRIGQVYGEDEHARQAVGDALPSLCCSAPSMPPCRAAKDEALYGNSVWGDEYYLDVDIDTWHEVMLWSSQECVDQSLKGEIVNYELVSEGKFEITLLSGNCVSSRNSILGYYYHSPDTYSDVKFVDITETELYDYLGGKAKIQYQLDGVDKWYDANYDMNDGPDDDSGAYYIRRGDDAYGIVPVIEKYGSRVTRFRGLTFPIDVPKGMLVGFYLKFVKMESDAQHDKLVRLGMPESALPRPFVPLNFSTMAFNYSETGKSLHRSWYHELADYTFFGMENIFSGGDLDCNDVMFGISATGLDMVMPDVTNPDIDHLVTVDEVLSWTIAYEDWGRDVDYDFNDAVIRLTPDFERRKMCVEVLAAGSDDRMWLHYDGPDGDVNLGEIHELLGQDVEKINTYSSMHSVPYVSIDCVDWPQGYTMANDAARFYIEVRRGTCEDCSDVITLAHEPGQTPEAICVAGKWNWPKEGVSILTTYGSFKDWSSDVMKMTYWNWYSYPKANTYVHQ